MNGDNEQYFFKRRPFMSQTAETLAVLDDRLRGLLRDYARREPAHDALAAEFGTLLDDPEDPFRRERLAGHFTASCWLVSADGQRLLLTHHRKLQRWLQLGGHADGDRDLARVALKEAEEESGLTGLVLEDPAIFDLDKHWIPERKDVPGHWHYDVRFVIRALGGARPSCSARSHLTWPGGRWPRSPPIRNRMNRCSAWRAGGWRAERARRAWPGATVIAWAGTCAATQNPGVAPGHARRRVDQYRMRVRNVPGIAASSSRTAAAWASLAVMSITT